MILGSWATESMHTANVVRIVVNVALVYCHNAQNKEKCLWCSMSKVARDYKGLVACMSRRIVTVAQRYGNCSVMCQGITESG